MHDARVSNYEDIYKMVCSETLNRCIFLMILHDSCPNEPILRNIKPPLKAFDDPNEYVGLLISRSFDREEVLIGFRFRLA